MQWHKNLWACFRFPDLPLNVFDWPDNAAIAVEESRTNQRLIAACNDQALAAGVRVGMTVPTAYSLCEGLVLQPRSLRAEAKYLRELALWAYQFSAIITLKTPHALLLELGSCLNLYSNWPSMQTHIQHQLESLGIASHFSVAHTPAAAFLYAQAGLPATDSIEMLESTLPEIDIRHLEVDATIKEALCGMGLNRLGQVLSLPRAGLSKRFGTGFSQYLQRVSGEQPDPQPAFSIPLHFQDEFDFIEEVEHLQGIQFALKRMFGKFEHYLRARQKQVQQYQITLIHRKQRTTAISVHFASRLQKAEDLFKMAQLKLETIQLEQPVIGMTLSAHRFLAQQEKARDLFGEQQAQEEKFGLLDKLQPRLGEQHCSGLSTAADHRPEKAWRPSAPTAVESDSRTQQRPLWLMTQPHALLERDGQPLYFGALQLLNGPERIETGWWDNQPINRDYFIARHAKGALYWIYFDRDERKWYVHGLFA